MFLRQGHLWPGLSILGYISYRQVGIGVVHVIKCKEFSQKNPAGRSIHAEVWDPKLNQCVTKKLSQKFPWPKKSPACQFSPPAPSFGIPLGSTCGTVISPRRASEPEQQMIWCQWFTLLSHIHMAKIGAQHQYSALASLTGCYLTANGQKQHAFHTNEVRSCFMPLDYELVCLW